MVICDLASAFYAVITCAHCPRQTLASYTLEWLYSQTSFTHLCHVSWHLLPLLQETRTIYHSPLLSFQPSHLPRQLICKSPKEMSTPTTIHDFIHVYYLHIHIFTCDYTRQSITELEKHENIFFKQFLFFSVSYPGTVLCLVAQSCLTLCNPMDSSSPSLHVPHHLPEFAQVHVHHINDTISPSALNLSQHQGLFQWVIPSHQMAKILQLQLQY